MERVAVKAKTMGAALSQVKKQFGDDAFIESTTEENGEIIIQVLVGQTGSDENDGVQTVAVVKKKAVQTQEATTNLQQAQLSAASEEVPDPSVEETTTPEPELTEQADEELQPVQTSTIAHTVTTVTKTAPTYRLKSPLAAIKLIYDLN